MTTGNKPNIKLVVFDMDDTLYNERDYVRSGYTAIANLLADTQSENTPEAADKFYGWMWQRFCSGQTDRMFNALSDEFSLGLEIKDIKNLVTCYRSHKPQISPLPEAEQILSYLHGKVKLALLSDGFLPAQQYKLDALGLEKYFDSVLFTESLGREYWKPNPEGFIKIVTELHVPHENCVYIGDNAAKDFAAPNSLGWLSLQWQRDGQIHTKTAPSDDFAPQITICDSEQLLQILQI